MADAVYTYVKELLDNTQYLEALKRAEVEEAKLTGLRTAGGTAAVKALKEIEKAQADAAKEADRITKQEMADAEKKASYLQRLRLQSVKDAEKAATQEAAAAARAAKGPSEWTLAVQANTKALGDQMAGINKAREATGALGAALGLVSPQLATVVGGIQKAEGAATAAAGAAQIFGASLSTVALVAGPLVAVIGTVAYAHQKEEERAKEAAARTEEYTTAVHALTDAMQTLNDQQVDLGERAGLLTGEFTAQEQAFDKAHTAAMKATASQREVLDEQLSALIARRDALRGQEQNRSMADTFFGQSPGDMAREGQEITKRIKTIEDGLKELDEQSTIVAETTAVVTKGEKDATDATKSRAKATKDLAAELEKEQKAQNDKRAGLLQEMEDRKQAIQLERKAEADQLIALEIAGEAREARFFKDQEMEDERVKKAKESAADRTQFELDYASAITGELSNALASVSDILVESNRKGAKAAYAASVALGLASTTIAALKAGAETVAAVAAIPGGAAFALPAGAAMFAATEAAYVAKVAATPPPMFTDTPGPVRMGAAMGTTATFAANDTIVAARTPEAMLRQVLDAVRERPGPAPEIGSTRRVPGGMRAIREPAILDLTSSLSRVTRGTISR